MWNFEGERFSSEAELGGGREPNGDGVPCMGRAPEKEATPGKAEPEVERGC